MIQLQLKRAFTLIEIVVVLGLIGLIATVFIVNLDGLMDSTSRKNPESTLSEIVTRASNLSQSMGIELKMSFDEENNQMLISNYLSEEPLEAYEFVLDEESPIKVRFEPVYPKVVDGSATSFNTVKEVDSMRFYPDSTSSKVRICLEYDGDEYEVVYDTFSLIKLEEKSDD